MPRRIWSGTPRRPRARSPITTRRRPRTKPPTPRRTVVGVPTNRTPKRSTLSPRSAVSGGGQIPVAPNEMAAATGIARAWRPTVRATRPQICLDVPGRQQNAATARPARAPTASVGTVSTPGRTTSRIVIANRTQSPPHTRPASNAAPRFLPLPAGRIAPLLREAQDTRNEEDGDHAVGSGLRNDRPASPLLSTGDLPMFRRTGSARCWARWPSPDAAASCPTAASSAWRS